MSNELKAALAFVAGVIAVYKLLEARGVCVAAGPVSICTK